ncbi:MAG: acetylglutamate kinase [Dehalococcoidales bacterium]|nr:acetylglutamate kinase [Dehalococcoidales bacterium]
MKKPIVVKIGGATFGKHDPILEDIVTLQKRGVLLVVIHGGGNLVTEWLAKQGTKTSFVRGERVTDKPALDMVTAVLGGLVNKQIVGTINTLGGKAVGISGVDGALIQSSITDKDLGYVGIVKKVEPAVLTVLLKAGFIPVISPISYYAFDRPPDAPPILNINGDPLAGEIAAALKAKKLIFLTDVAGILDKSGKLMPKLNKAQARELLDSGVASGGMIPKITGCLKALEVGATTCIIDGRQPGALIKAIENDGDGTVIRV